VTEIRHGYTLGDIDKMARSACVADRSMASDVDTRYSTAWSAIAEHLCASAEPPAWQDLVRAGWQAIYQEVREMRHTFGQSRDDPNAEVASGKRFQQYWFTPPIEPEFGLIERVAIGQIMPCLTPVYRDAVIALAVTDDYQRAADMLGIGYKALVARIGVARKTFRGHWFAPDAAPPIRGTDRRVGAYGRAPQTHCARGHEMSGDNVRMRLDRKQRVCRACERERSARRHKEVSS
jgi:hypothetical protein